MTMTYEPNNIVIQKINRNLCNMFFLSSDDLVKIRLQKHEEWHEKATYFGSSNVRMIRKVEWRYENVQ